MVRRAAEMKIVDAKRRQAIADLGDQDMDMDTNGHDHDFWDGMDTEMAASRTSPEVEELEIRTMAFGQMLQVEYAGDTDKNVSKTLGDIYSLMAYDDPFSAPMAHLLDRRGRAAVAEELNSAILCEYSPSLCVARLRQLGD